MVDCCGYRFCKDCIMSVYVAFKKCPLCNGAFSSVIHDKLLQRTLNEKLVYCTHKDAGCDWTGKLVTLDQHLNTMPDSLENRLEGCSVQGLRCNYCDDNFKRCDLSDHESKCPRRPIKCVHCEAFSAPETELGEHWKECKCFPVQCENNCGETVNRERMAKHLSEHCPLVVIACDYSYAGCDATLPRKEMMAHIDEAAKDHLQLMAKELTRQKNVSELINKSVSYLQNELIVHKMESEIALAGKDNEIALKDETIEQLKQLCDFRDACGDSANQVLILHFSEGTTVHHLKSLFGQFGRIQHVDFYPWRSMAMIEFEEHYSVHRMFDRYETRGIMLRGADLDCIRLCH